MESENTDKIRTDLNIKSVPISEIKIFEKNPKGHPESQILGLMESIKTYGITQPAVIDKNHVLIIGHGRLEAAKRLGLTSFPCVVKEELLDFEVRALRLIDNKISETFWDQARLEFELSSIEYDFERFNISFDEDLESLKKLEESDEGPQGMQDAPEEENYMVLVTCDDADSQERLYEELKERGFKCKAVS